MNGRRVPATIVDDVDDALDTPGAIEFSGSGLFYVCPCGCRQVGYLAFKPASSPSWSFDGNRERPTLEPSIHHTVRRSGQTETHWHGYLRAGVFEDC